MNTYFLLPLLGELLVKSTVVLLLGAFIVRIWSGASAAQRHFVWLAAILVLLLLPLTRLMTPRWKVPIERPMRISLPVALTQPAPLAESPGGPALRENIRQGRAWPLVDWRAVLLGAWLAGGIAVTSYRLLGSWRLRQLKKHSTPMAGPREFELAQSALEELRIDSQVAVRISDQCRVPVTWGIRRPVLLLPSEALGWSEARLTAALRHEAGHIRRRDYLVRWLAHVACALYWPNPLVWLAARSLRLAQEQATDDLVLRAGTSPEEYAAQLFDSARTVAAHGLFARHAVAMATPSTLEKRVLAIVDAQRDRRPLSSAAVTVGCLLVSLTLAVCTAAQLRGADSPPAPGAPAAGPNGRQIMIEAKFVQIPADPAETEGWLRLPAEKAVFTDLQFQDIARSLNSRKDVDILAAPRVVTTSKRSAVIEVGRDFRYPKNWVKDSDGSWKPTEFETKKIGVTLDVRPEIRADGSIELQLKPGVVEFAGIIDLDKGKGLAEVADASKPGAGLMAQRAPELPPGKRSTPFFFEREMQTAIVLRSGETAILTGMKEAGEAKPFETVASTRKLVVFVSASIVDPATAKEIDAAAPRLTPAQRAAQIIIPKVAFQDAPLTECVGSLRRMSGALSPDGQELNIILKPAAGAGSTITLILTNVPLAEVLRYVAELAGLELVAQPEALVLRTPENRAPASIPSNDPEIRGRDLTGSSGKSSQAGGSERPGDPGSGAKPPVARWVPGKPGFVTSPYEAYRGWIDVRGFPEGTEIKDPYSGKSFLVPALPAPEAGKPEPLPPPNLLQQPPKDSRIEGRAGIELRQANPAVDRLPIARRPGGI